MRPERRGYLVRASCPVENVSRDRRVSVSYFRAYRFLFECLNSGMIIDGR